MLSNFHARSGHEANSDEFPLLEKTPSFAASDG
jgi:hypothetical protein